MTKSQLPLPEGAFVDYLEQQATAATVQQIEQDADLLAETAMLAAIDSALHTIYDRARCPSAERLIEFEYRLLNDGEYADVAQHMGSCSLCRRDLRALQQISVAETRPVGWLSQLLQGGKQLLEMVVQSQKLSLALRGDVGDSATFTHDPYRIFLSKQQTLTTESVWQINGQLFEAELPLFDQHGTVHLTQADELVQQNSIDDFGAFQFVDVPTGEYTLAVEMESAILLATPYTV